MSKTTKFTAFTVSVYLSYSFCIMYNFAILNIRVTRPIIIHHIYRRKMKILSISDRRIFWTFSKRICLFQSLKFENNYKFFQN